MENRLFGKMLGFCESQGAQIVEIDPDAKNRPLLRCLQRRTWTRDELQWLLRQHTK